MTKPDFMMQTYIRCSQDALWDALTNADAVQHYDFLEQTAERRGDTLVYRTPDGTETLHTKEMVVEPKTRLVTSFEPKWEPDAKTSEVTYLIEPQGDYCCLTVEHRGLAHDPSGGTADGWVRSLAGLKTWLETGTPTHFGGDHLWDEHEEA
ncbi:hypothetical protein GTA62_08245 [Roseobacter sp. HKCCD9010]|uniref:SRPBCC domain-containing protein n=1 Tax=unclassified Roseobacter TaxID=196798 RepID=UPI001492EA2B|nr:MULTISPECIES: SRPBCC domain-containing protein [unclassified Roseobacter]MBF9051307.1 hypothetical protein [Rhodobacterales bacterium HKCCD4356]NNV13354.1 hypothetical protein [Roseobacter sp. HKCCD7357]NNV17605.1 hypothetical protein [Roseobacter sp. HKCCD8768]NNV27211.1 hypothetical protein [Roseobacter sp. HKCCD8192]NNV31331.1 hypothetical protein [Roseobacter sp. HKCCD9061]